MKTRTIIKILLMILALACVFLVFTTEESDIRRKALGLSAVILVISTILHSTVWKSDKNKSDNDGEDENGAGSSN